MTNKETITAIKRAYRMGKAHLTKGLKPELVTLGMLQWMKQTLNFAMVEIPKGNYKELKGQYNDICDVFYKLQDFAQPMEYYSRHYIVHPVKTITA